MNPWPWTPIRLSNSKDFPNQDDYRIRTKAFLTSEALQLELELMPTVSSVRALQVLLAGQGGGSQLLSPSKNSAFNYKKYPRGSTCVIIKEVSTSSLHAQLPEGCNRATLSTATDKVLRLQQTNLEGLRKEAWMQGRVFQYVLS